MTRLLPFLLLGVLAAHASQTAHPDIVRVNPSVAYWPSSSGNVKIIPQPVFTYKWFVNGQQWKNTATNQTQIMHQPGVWLTVESVCSIAGKTIVTKPTAAILLK